MSEILQREWRFYLDDIIRFAENVIAYTDGFNQARFVESRLNYDATVRNLELIGEAATHIPDIIRENNPQVPWRQIIATRNRLIHGYLGIDNATLNNRDRAEGSSEEQTVSFALLTNTIPKFRVIAINLSRHTGMDCRYPGCMDASSPRRPWNLGSGIPCRNDGFFLS